MRFTTIIFFLLSIVFVSTAQEDDFPDYRNKKETFLKMQEKDIRGELASFTLGGLDERIGKLPLKSIPVAGYDKNSMTFQGDNIKVILKTGRFEPSKHKLDYYEEKYLVKIDKKGYQGNYGSLPFSTIQSITVLVDGDSVAIPPAAFADIHDPVLTYNDGSGSIKSHNKVYVSRDNKKIYIYFLNREPKGGYEVTWVIQDKKYLRRVVDFGFLK